jgi:tetratricopeptide (TPR) repeat protein
MKLVLTIVVAALAALLARELAPRSAAGAPAQRPEADTTATRRALAELRGENARLAEELDRRTNALVAPSASASEIGEAEIAAALERFEAARADEPAAVTERRPAASAAELELATVPMGELVAVLAETGFGNEERQRIFQALRDNGRIDEYVAAIEALAEANPNDVDLQVALGHAYLQKLFGVGNSPEAGPLAFKSDAAFDRALALDDENWSARFSKAVSLSNWPAFLGRGPEAIEHFEILIEQQASQPKRPEFAMSYLFLGNMQQAAGQREQALATWRAGLEQFPEHDDLAEALALASTLEGAGASDRPTR